MYISEKSRGGKKTKSREFVKRYVLQTSTKMVDM